MGKVTKGTAGAPDSPGTPAKPAEVPDGGTRSGGGTSTAPTGPEAAPTGSTSASPGTKPPETVGTSEAEKKEAPEPKAKAEWSKEKVLPDRNSSFPPATPPTDVVPEDSKAGMKVTTENVPDGARATITVRHCATNAVVRDGIVAGLEVKGGKVVDPATGKEPEFVFDAAKTPWDPWEKPYYYFEARIESPDLLVETPKDFGAQEAKCLRVLYWHLSVTDGSLPGMMPECQKVAGLLENEGMKTKALSRNLGTSSPPMAQWGSLLRNCYTFHEASHGNLVDRTTNLPSWCWQDISINPPVPDHSGSEGSLPGPVGNWRSTVTMGLHSPATVTFPAGSRNPGRVWSCDQFGDLEAANTTDIPSVPRYLFYASCCVAGWESSFADAVIARGCRNVLAFKMFIPDAEAPDMAEKFFKLWLNTYRLNPEKIPDSFFKVGGDFYDKMRPVLYGKGGGSIDGGGPSALAVAGIIIGVLIVGAVVAFAAYKLLKK